jgi:hypothetical protein
LPEHKETIMAPAKSKSFLSLDLWAVLLSLAAALLIHLGVIKTIAW